MKARTLIAETYLRKSSLRFMHLCWLGTLAAIFLIPLPEDWPWGAFVFVWSGCLLSLVLSAGILGDDIASGRIRMLVTEPIRLWELYVYRFLGLSLQAAVHLSVAGVLILLLHWLTGRGSIDRFVVWLFASWLMFNAWAALSTSLSVVVRREQNSMLLVLGTIAAVFPLYMLMLFFEDSTVTKVYHEVLRYAGPSVELLVQVGQGQRSLSGCVANVAHSLLVIVLYGAIGILLLDKREFTHVAD